MCRLPPPRIIESSSFAIQVERNESKRPRNRSSAGLRQFPQPVLYNSGSPTSIVSLLLHLLRLPVFGAPVQRFNPCIDMSSMVTQPGSMKASAMSSAIGFSKDGAKIPESARECNTLESMPSAENHSSPTRFHFVNYLFDFVLLGIDEFLVLLWSADFNLLQTEPSISAGRTALQLSMPEALHPFWGSLFRRPIRGLKQTLGRSFACFRHSNSLILSGTSDALKSA